MHHVTEYSPAKIGEYPIDIPQLSTLKDNKHNSLHFVWTLSVSWAYSCSQASHWENCLLLRTDNVH